MVIVTIVPGKGSVSVLKRSLLARNSYISLSEVPYESGFPVIPAKEPDM